MKWILALGLLTASMMAHADATTVEIQPQMFLAPTNGFDTTDQVQGVTYGVLPNGCYTIANATVEKTGDHDFIVHQFAYQQIDGDCQNENRLSKTLSQPQPYTAVVKFGALPQGSYQVHFTKAGGLTGSRTINVARALAAADHAFPYAGISNAIAKSPIHPADHLVVNYTGTLNNGCAYMETNLQVQREADVFILSPKILRHHGMCEQVLIPFKNSVDLGTVPPGYYLIHVRGMNGTTLDRVVHAETSL